MDPDLEANDPVNVVTESDPQPRDPTDVPPDPRREARKPVREARKPVREATKLVREATKPICEARVPGFEACLPRSEAKIRRFSSSPGLQPSYGRVPVRLRCGAMRLQCSTTNVPSFVSTRLCSKTEPAAIRHPFARAVPRPVDASRASGLTRVRYAQALVTQPSNLVSRLLALRTFLPRGSSWIAYIINSASRRT